MSDRTYLLLAIMAMLLAGTALCSQAQNSHSGIWQGTLSGTQARIVLHLSSDKSGLHASLDSPDQGVMALQATATIEGDSLQVAITKPVAAYRGKWVNDSTLVGNWIQGESKTRLDFLRTNEAIRLNRPQTPLPPFPYQTEDVIYFNHDRSIQYGATITIPHGKGPFPALLLITGSGQQNRDEEIMGHKPFAVIADFLTRRGFIVMRVDDRGIGQTTGDFAGSTSRDFADDAEVGLDYLLHRKEVNKKKTGLLGHSEGAMIAEMIAAERKDVNFIVLMAGPGETIVQLMRHQDSAVLASVGMGKSYITPYCNLYANILSSVMVAPSKGLAIDTVTKLVRAWTVQTPKSIVLATSGIRDDSSQQSFVTAFVDQLFTPWWKYFLKYDPRPVLEKISCKVLALNGNKDIQVIAATNLPAMEEALSRSLTRIYEVKELRGLNHLFQRCTLCTIAEYAKLEETISPDALQTIGEWLAKNEQ